MFGAGSAPDFVHDRSGNLVGGGLEEVGWPGHLFGGCVACKHRDFAKIPCLLGWFCKYPPAPFPDAPLGALFLHLGRFEHCPQEHEGVSPNYMCLQSIAMSQWPIYTQ